MATAFLCVVLLLQDYYHVKFLVVVLSHIIVFFCVMLYLLNVVISLTYLACVLYIWNKSLYGIFGVYD
jgi:hypothetical protein